MKRFFSLIFLTSTASRAMAQSNPGEGFLDKYLPIAQLFDSPLFFAAVVGSAVLLLAITMIFLQYAKTQEKKAEAWGQGKSPQTLIEQLDNPIPDESRLAYIYIRKHCDDLYVAALLDNLEDQRRRGNINPTLIYLLEDLEISSAIPLLQQIAKGKSSTANLAQRVADRLLELQEEEKKDQTKEPVKST